MTDQELIKRVADILGRNYYHYEGSKTDCVIDGGIIHEEFNPLANNNEAKAFCWDLMVKYKLSLIAPEGEQAEWDCVIRDVLTVDKNPQRAILLAFVELNNKAS